MTCVLNQNAFLIMCGLYTVFVSTVLISFNMGLSTETNLPMKELADLNLALESFEKAVEALEKLDNIKNENEQSHKLAYLILGIIGVFLIIKGLKLDFSYKSNQSVSAQLPMDGAIVPSQPAEAAVSSALQLIQAPETRVICFQPIESPSIDPGILSIPPAKGIYPLLDDFLNLNWWLHEITGRSPITGKFQNFTSQMFGSLSRNHASYHGGLRSKLVLPDDMERFLSNSRGPSPSSQSTHLSTHVIDEGAKVLGDEPIRLTASGYFGDGLHEE